MSNPAMVTAESGPLSAEMRADADAATVEQLLQLLRDCPECGHFPADIEELGRQLRARLAEVAA